MNYYCTSFGYSCGSRTGVILDISKLIEGGSSSTVEGCDDSVDVVESEEGVALQDTQNILQYTRFRVCQWILNDRYVLLATSASSIFGCPMLTAYRTIDGVCIARFCSPYPHNISHIDVILTANSKDNAAAANDNEGREEEEEEEESTTTLISVADEQGEIFLLRLVGF